MSGIGTLVNAGAILVGCTVGALLKGGIPDKVQKMIFTAVGVSVMLMGIMGVIENAGNSMLLVLSMVIGGVIGELIDLEAWFERIGEFLKKKVVKDDSTSKATFVEGFVSSSILFCVGAMAIVGSLNDGLRHDPSILFTKAILDGISSIVMTASLGIGVAFSIIPVIIYQGLITLLAGVLEPVLTDTLVQNMCFVGNAIIFCIGINFIIPKKVKVGNLLPAIFLPIILGIFLK